jgi:NRPS condensation-like uncharacterized protein
VRAVNRGLSITEKSSLLANSVRAHNASAYIDYVGEIEKSIFIEALEHIQTVFPCLKACIVSKPNIRFTSGSCKIPFNELVVLNHKDFQTIFENEINSPFDLNISPLIRIIHLKSQFQKRLIITMNHLICDGVSLSYFVGYLFTVIESILSNHPLEDFIFPFQEIEKIFTYDLKNLNYEIVNDVNVISESSFQFTPSATKTIQFNIDFPDKVKRGSLGINSLIMASAGVALAQNLTHEQPIHFVVPVDLRPYAERKISNYQLGFYSSWIEFYQNISCTSEFLDVANKLSCEVKSLLKNVQHLENISQLGKSFKTKKPRGIIENIQEADRPSICISNIGLVNMKTDYNESKIQIKSVYLGLNSFYQSKNSFLLLAMGLGDSIYFTFHYRPPYMEYYEAAKLVEAITRSFKEYA